MSEFKELFSGDLARYGGAIPKWTRRFLYLFRKASTCRNPILRRYYRFAFRKNSEKHGMEIRLGVQIGKGLFIGHPYLVTINEKAVLGNNINLH